MVEQYHCVIWFDIKRGLEKKVRKDVWQYASPITNPWSQLSIVFNQPFCSENKSVPHPDPTTSQADFIWKKKVRNWIFYKAMFSSEGMKYEIELNGNLKRIDNWWVKFENISVE